MDNYNNQEDVGQEMLNDIGNRGKSIGKSVVGSATRGAKSAGKKIAKSMFASAIKAGKALLAKAVVALGPYLLLIVGALMLIGFFWVVFDFEIDSRGVEKRYEKDSDNPVIEVGNGYFTAGTPIAENRAIAQLYKYFSENSYYQIVVDSDGRIIDGKLKNPEEQFNAMREGDVPVVDYHGREKLFYLPTNLLFTVDDYLYGGEVFFPEQLVKPVKHNPGDFTLSHLTDVIDEEGEERVLSEDTKSINPESGKAVVGVWDYGLAPIFKYFSAERYEKIEAKVVAKDVIMPSANNLTKDSYLIMEDIPESQQTEINAELPDTRSAIYLMHSATSFAGNFYWTYTFNEEEMGMRISSLSIGAESKDPISKAEFVIVDEIEVYDWESKIVYTSFSSMSLNNLFYLLEFGMVDGIYHNASTKELFVSAYGSMFKSYYSNYELTETMIAELGGSVSEIGSISDLPLYGVAYQTASRMATAVGARDFKVNKVYVSGFGNIVVEYEVYVYIKTLVLREKRDGSIVEYMPRINDETVDNHGERYFMDYFENFETWVPESFSESVNFEERVDTLLRVTLNVGSNAKLTNKAFVSSKRYATEVSKYDTDKEMILAIIAYHIDFVDREKKQKVETLAEYQAMDYLSKRKVDLLGISHVGADVNGSWDGAFNGVWYTWNDRMDDAKSIELAVNKIKDLEKKYPGTHYSELVSLLAYNWGEVVVDAFISAYPEDFSNGSLTWLNRKKDFIETKYVGLMKDEYFNINFVEDVLSYYEGEMGYNELNNFSKKEQTLWDKFFSVLKKPYEMIVAKYDDTRYISHSKSFSRLEMEEMVIMSLTFAEGTIKGYSEFTFDDNPYWNFTEVMSMTSVHYSTIGVDDINLLIPNLMNYGKITPIQYPITSPFGLRTHPVTGKPNAMHWGIDVGTPQGTPMLSPFSGFIRFRGAQGTYGNLLEIELDDGVIVRYAHLSEFVSGLNVGARVEKGQVVAYSGGNVGTPGAGRSTGAHLHFEVMLDNAEYKGFIDPFFVVNNPHFN